MSGVLQQDAEIGDKSLMVTAAGFGKKSITSAITDAAAGGVKVNIRTVQYSKFYSTLYHL